jgi:hypothetical protein
MYIITKANRIIAIDSRKEGYSEDHFEIVPWEVSVSGPLPRMANVDDEPSEFIDTRGYAEKRRCAYILELDSILSSALGCIEDGDDKEQAMQTWRAKRAEIKARYPK